MSTVKVTTVTRDTCQTRSSASLVYDDKSFQRMWDMDVSIGDGEWRACLQTVLESREKTLLSPKRWERKAWVSLSQFHSCMH